MRGAPDARVSATEGAGMITMLQGDCRDVLTTLDAGSVQTCITSPPYFGLRNYGVEGQIGLEESPEQYVAALVDVFAEVKRVLRDDGTVWLNLGDSYMGGGPHHGATNLGKSGTNRGSVTGRDRVGSYHDGNIKTKDLIGIPWMVAFALRADGWYLRQEIIWHKPNAMPESVTDRPSRAHEQVFLLSKSRTYFYDADAIREDSSPSSQARAKYNGGDASPKAYTGVESGIYCGVPSTAKAYGQGRNKRSVWTIATQPFSGAHFAAFPEKLVEPCILAGSRPGDVVLDPFGGSGTIGRIALKHGRRAILIELNPAYIDLADTRTNGVQVSMESLL